MLTQRKLILNILSRETAETVGFFFSTMCSFNANSKLEVLDCKAAFWPLID